MKTARVKWKATAKDQRVISQIAERAVPMMADAFPDYDVEWAQMDVTACHLNGTPLRLNELLAADDVNFGHDIRGIRRFMDRVTGKLDPIFCPRFAKAEN